MKFREKEMYDQKIRFASRKKRFWGNAIDVLLVMILAVPMAMLIGLVPIATRENIPTKGQQLGFSGLIVAVYFILNGYLLWRKGQTLGKVLMGTRIVGRNRQRVPFVRIFFLRQMFLYVIALIVDLALSSPLLASLVGFVDAAFIFSDENRCLHDRMAGTIVVVADEKPVLRSSSEKEIKKID
ncbi:MAG: RDD family protein [Candidatus Aminicenantes bacterium]|nr:RDD family protein [Candidatus Aminicenantes bacterium]